MHGSRGYRLYRRCAWETGPEQSLIDSFATMTFNELGSAANRIFLTENAKDTLCRNVTIYGRCRYEDKGTVTNPLIDRGCIFHYCELGLTINITCQGCAFNHDPLRVHAGNQSDRLGHIPERLAFLSESKGQLELVDWAVGLHKRISSSSSSSSKKRLNVESPSFTPSSLSVNGSSTPKKTTTISPKAASAAPFQPKSIASRMGAFVFRLVIYSVRPVC